MIKQDSYDEWRKAMQWLADVARIKKTEKDLQGAMSICKLDSINEKPLFLVDMFYTKEGILITERSFCFFDSRGIVTAIPPLSIYAAWIDDNKMKIVINREHQFTFRQEYASVMLVLVEALRKVIEASWDSVSRPFLTDAQVSDDFNKTQGGKVKSWLKKFRNIVQEENQPIISFYDIWHPIFPPPKTEKAVHGMVLLWEAAIHLVCAQHCKISSRVLSSFGTPEPILDKRLWAWHFDLDDFNKQVEKAFQPVPTWPVSALEAINLAYCAIDSVNSDLQGSILQLIIAARVEEAITQQDAEGSSEYKQIDQSTSGGKYLDPSMFALRRCGATVKDVLTYLQKIGGYSILMRLFENIETVVPNEKKWWHIMK